MSRRQRSEQFENYRPYLDQDYYWISESGEGATILIEDMVPRYAHSALQKLIRWSHTPYSLIDISSSCDREHRVLTSKLGRALAARASGILEVTPAAESDAVEVTPREMIVAFAPIVLEHTGLDFVQCFKLCEALATHADDEWTVTTSRDNLRLPSH